MPMLSKEQRDLIRENRKFMTEGRTERIVAWGRLFLGKNPVTGEERYTDSPRIEYDVIIKIPVLRLNKPAEEMFGGIVIENGDRMVTFNDPDIDIDPLQYIEHDGVIYRLLAKSPVGLGGTNRYECLARVVT